MKNVYISSFLNTFCSSVEDETDVGKLERRTKKDANEMLKRRNELRNDLQPEDGGALPSCIVNGFSVGGKPF